PVEAQHRNPPAVDHSRIDLAVRLLVGDHLPATREADGGAPVLAILVLERRAVAAALTVAMDAPHEAVTRHSHPAPDLDVVSAREVELGVVEPPRHVQVCATHAIAVVAWLVDQRRDEAAYVGAGGVGDVLADHAA